MARDYATEGIVADRLGRPLFHCPHCGGPLTTVDFARLGLRLPDPAESASDYCDAELIDDLAHFDCPTAVRSAV